MISYKIIRTDKAEEQLRGIIFYIAADAGNIDVALEYLDKIETIINQLRECSSSGSNPRYSVLRKQGYKMLIAEKHLVFYKVNEEEKVITVYAIVEGKTEYKNLM